MKKKSTSKSAFFNLRVLICLCIVLAGALLTLLGFGTFSGVTANSAQAQQNPAIMDGPTLPVGSCSWLPGPALPSVGTRFVGVFFPANGKFYAMGGRSSDSAGSDFMHPFEYDGTSWTTKAATYPDNQVNNMACGVLNDSGTDYIYCVGGSAAGATTAIDRVFRYNPVTDTITTVGAPWPGDTAGITLPGGFSVYNNKFYILGGFQINIAMQDSIWEFTPGTNAWVQKSAVLPDALGYIPTTTIGNYIYTGGGDEFDPTQILVDTNNSYRYDPVGDTIITLPNVPRVTSNTRGVNFCNQLWVLGGQWPTASNEVDIYDPVGNSWSVGTPLPDARRNFAGDTDGTNNIWMAGGYDGTSIPVASMFNFNCPVSPCASPTPSPTPTCTPGGTPGPWMQAAVYPISVYGAGVASDGTNIYAFGGNTIGGAQHAEAYKYDPAANTWTALASINTGADYLFHAEYGGNGKIYVMGGLNGGTLNRIYDIGTNGWSAGAAIPEAVYDHGHAYYNGKIYVIGGIVNGIASSVVYSYDVATNTWSAPLAPLPQAEFNMACTAINNKIYCANGSTGSDQISNLYIYDIAGNSWSAGPSSPLGSNFPAGTAIGGQLYMIGGGNPFLGPRGAADAPGSPESFQNTYLYDPVANTWGSGPSLNVARSFGNAATVNTTGGETAVVVGGYNSDQGASLTDVETSTLAGCASPTPTPTPSQIVLTARTRLQGNCKLVQLTWTGVITHQVVVYRNGVRIARVPNRPPVFKDTLCHSGGQTTYQVCEGRTQNCSNEVMVRGTP